MTRTIPALDHVGPQRYRAFWYPSPHGRITMPPMAWDPGRPIDRRPVDEAEVCEAIDQIGRLLPALDPSDRCATVRMVKDGYRARLLVTELKPV